MILKRNISKGKGRNSLQEEGDASLPLISLLNVKSQGENGTQSKEVIAISIDTPEFAFQSVPLGLRRVCENVNRLYATSTTGQGAVRVPEYNLYLT